MLPPLTSLCIPGNTYYVNLVHNQIILYVLYNQMVSLPMVPTLKAVQGFTIHIKYGVRTLFLETVC